MNVEAATKLRIDVGLLVDAYVSHRDVDCGGCEGFGAHYPSIYEFDIDGTPWLSDRFWLLPKSICDLPADIKAMPLSDSATVTKVTEWVTSLTNAPLAESSRLFAPMFAGYFTTIGVTAWDIGHASGMHALTDADGNRMGGLMPFRADNIRGPLSARLRIPLPCSQATQDMYRRLAGVDCIHPWQAWTLAANLTVELPEDAS